MCNDLFDENEHFLDFEMLKRKFNIQMNLEHIWELGKLYFQI